jgi:hypothetical protein
LALGGKHTPTDVQADRFTKLDPRAATVGTITINCFGLCGNNLCDFVRIGRQRGKDQKECKMFHIPSIA